ncbi:MAG: DNA mismatch repair endonuclease MutL [Bacillota bacterium]|jgi:DNA mismatch repair protein MutL|nr:DNA mismatch repair endonuclease MutL [Bacillota bacterium]MDD4707851.1 DNA mismatch repair endonuclease MutL [Bacillota bacterium]
MSKRIRLLDKTVTERIAAGEVVENPSSVVKELLENSIDAGATVIEVEIERGGKDLIRVVDNGEGIERDDVDKAFLRHATSKISSDGDLLRLSTLGFRGEALAAIAAVSLVNLTTRTGDSIEGTLYSIDRNRDVAFRETGCAQGTCIEVRELFYNTPARQEYLKSDSYEASMINDIVSRLALARPDISFRLTSNGRVLLNTPGNGDIEDMVSSVYGKNILDNLVQVKCNAAGLRISGFVSTPYGTRSNRNYQSFFINGRYVKSKIVSRALEDAYRTLIMVNRYPIAVLYFTLDSGSVDVNVHPAKLEVKFREEDQVRKAVYGCIRTALEKGRWLAGHYVPAPGVTLCTTPESLRDRAQNIRLMEETVEYNRIELDNNIEGGSPGLPEMNVVGQFLSTFILAEGQDCIYLIDQHAAHERIMYEKINQDMQRGNAVSQTILQPMVVDLSPVELEAIRANESFLISIGYEFDEFGANTIRVKAVPVFLGIPQSKEFIIDLIDMVSRQSEKERKELKQDDIIMMACKRAVKANQRLSLREMESLLEQLAGTKMPYTCPHGRPVIVTLTRYDLEKMFKRIV